jgi:hypothetical protein
LPCMKQFLAMPELLGVANDTVKLLYCLAVLALHRSLRLIGRGDVKVAGAHRLKCEGSVMRKRYL